MTQTQTFLHMTSLLLGLLAVALALSALPAEFKSRFRHDPAAMQIDPGDVATARGLRDTRSGGDGGVTTNRQRN